MVVSVQGVMTLCSSKKTITMCTAISKVQARPNEVKHLKQVLALLCLPVAITVPSQMLIVPCIHVCGQA